MANAMQGYTETADSVEDDEMGDISVANHYHYGATPTAEPPAKEPAVIAQAKPSKPRISKEDLESYIKKQVAKGIAAAQPAVRPVVSPVAPTPATETVAVAEPAAAPWYKRYAVPLAIAAGTLGTGGAGLATYNYLNKPTAAAAPQEQTAYQFKISSKPGHGISAE